MQPEYDPTAQEQDLTLRNYLDILNKRRYTALTVFGIVFVISMIMALSQDTPLYTSSSTILLERNMSGNNQGLGTYYYWDPEFLPTQTEIIKSKRVAYEVVNDLELATKYRSHFLETDENNQSLPVAIKRGLKRLIRSIFSGDKNQEAPSQTATTDILDIETLEKHLIADGIIKSIEVAPIKETRVVSISYTDTNPEIAKLITDAIVQAYIEETLEIKLSSTKQALKWMTSKASEERKKLEDSERNLQLYMRENNLVTLEDRLAVFPEKLRQFSTDLSNAETRRKELEELLAQVNQFKGSPKSLESLPAFTQNANLQSLRDQILKAEQRIKELSQKYGPKHPAMIKAVDDYNILLREKEIAIARIIESSNKSYELALSNERNLRELLNKTQQELLDVNERFIQYSIMKREVESNRALFEALTSSLKKTSVSEESSNLNIWVMREANLPIFPSNQKPKRNVLIGLILSVAAGIGITLLIEYFDNTIKEPSDIEKRFGLTVIGSILETKKNERIESIIQEHNLSPVAENYRMIRSSLMLSSADRPPKTILVTSMKAKEGKTSTSLNLARTLAQVTEKVLLIDADMRKPRMHSLLKVPNEVGLSTYLSGNIDEEIILSSADDKIDIIPSGPIPPNPVELISSNAMKTLLRDVAKEYDFVIVDSPPIIQLADGLIISTLVDGTLIVTRVGKTTYDIFQSGLKKLSDLKPHILGVILNAMGTRITSPYYYYQYYEHYSQDNKDRRKKDRRTK